MFQRKPFPLILVLCFSLALSAHAGEKAPQKVIDLAQSQLTAFGKDPAIVLAVKDQNAKGQDIDAIKAMDEKWKATAGVADFMKALIDSPCGRRLNEIQKSAAYFSEIFVMDHLGANVAMTDKTSDYWQGDEEKFTGSYQGGKGGLHVSDVEFDESAQAYLVQVSVPVWDGDKVIGAITFGIDVDQIQ